MAPTKKLRNGIRQVRLPCKSHKTLRAFSDIFKPNCHMWRWRWCLEPLFALFAQTQVDFPAIGFLSVVNHDPKQAAASANAFTEAVASTTMPTSPLRQAYLMAIREAHPCHLP